MQRLERQITALPPLGKYHESMCTELHGSPRIACAARDVEVVHLCDAACSRSAVVHGTGCEAEAPRFTSEASQQFVTTDNPTLDSELALRTVHRYHLLLLPGTASGFGP